MSKTMAGGFITLVSSIFMFLLFVSELSTWMGVQSKICTQNVDQLLWLGLVGVIIMMFASTHTGYFMTVQVLNELTVDTSRGEQLPINVRCVFVQVHVLAYACIFHVCISTTHVFYHLLRCHLSLYHLTRPLYNRSILRCPTCRVSGLALTPWTLAGMCSWTWCVLGLCMLAHCIGVVHVVCGSV